MIEAKIKLILPMALLATIGLVYTELCYENICGNNSPLSQKSHVENFEGLSELFDILVSSPSDYFEHRWNVITFSNDFGVDLSKNHFEFEKDIVNCTVVYFDDCVSWNKCRQSCRSIGANSYRWFHDGCCECVGSTCINYGINKSLCRYCPEEADIEELDPDNYNEHILYD